MLGRGATWVNGANLAVKHMDIGPNREINPPLPKFHIMANLSSNDNWGSWQFFL
jgi:hypothetical protein